MLGPLCDDVAAMFGNYAPNVEARYSSSPVDGLRGLADVVDSVSGCSDVLCTQYDSSAVGIAAAQADAVVVCLGNGAFFTLIYTSLFTINGSININNKK